MKRIALAAVLLTLGTGAALAAPTNPAPVTHHPAMKTAMVASRGQQANRETAALNLLEAKGYASFTNFQPAGKDFTARVTQNGHAVKVSVDPQSGRIATIS